jgi:hypothetical protein
MRKLHGRHDVVDNHGGAKSRAEAEKQHAASLVAAERLHRRIIHDARGPAKGLAKIESHPARTEIVRLGDHFAVHHHAGIADRNGVVFPIPGELMDLLHHFARCEVRTGIELAHFAAAEDAGLHVAAAHVDGENPPMDLGIHFETTP